MDCKSGFGARPCFEGVRTNVRTNVVMYNNLESGTVAGEKNTYGNAGDKVIDTYAQAKGEVKTEFTSCDAITTTPVNSPAQIKQKMLNKINEVGPGNVSDHTVSDRKGMNVFDVRPTTVSDPTKFHKSLAGDKRVNQVLSKVNKPAEKSIHVSIVQKK